MQTMTTVAALSRAIAGEMRADPTVIFFGEGVATKQAALVQEFGAERVRNTPLAEAIIAGTAAGAAATGLRPVVDLLFAPFLTLAMDAIVNSAGKLRFLSGGQFEFPMVVLAMTGAGWGVGGQHNHNIEAWFAHSPGLRVVMPSNALDCAALMRCAIRDPNPVIFFVDIGIAYQTADIPDVLPELAIGAAAAVRQGSDVTLISYGKTVATCLEAAATLASEGVQAEVLDLRSLKPLDLPAILASATKTGRVVVVHEASATCGIGAEVSALIAEHAFGALKAPLLRVTGPDAPCSSSVVLEQAFVPSAQRILDAARLTLCHP
jgi:pyruvate/2-oxoglutarate/acetoin dehydrogenase E1 component